MEGVLGSGFRGDIAVDDVVLSNGACSGLCCIYQQSEHTLENRGSQWLSFISILFVGDLNSWWNNEFEIVQNW